MNVIKDGSKWGGQITPAGGGQFQSAGGGQFSRHMHFDGKIKNVRRFNSSLKSDLEFFYDPMGNRVLKIEKPRDGSGIKSVTFWKYTYYTHDAQGNLMATYTVNYDVNYKFKLAENLIYGSNRIGVLKQDAVLMTSTNCPATEPDITKAGTIYSKVFTNNTDYLTTSTAWTWPEVINGEGSLYFTSKGSNNLPFVTAIYRNSIDSMRFYEDKNDINAWKNYDSFVVLNLLTRLNMGYYQANDRWLGTKQYELTNHLGNVQVTISDRKLPHFYSPSVIDYYLPDVLSATDYYPFGMPMPGRSFSSSNYRYGYNGKENDNEVKGNGNSLDFGARIYDSRLGRWYSLDPSMSIYPNLSPYNSFENNPIFFKDPNGKDAVVTIEGNTITVSATIQIYGSGATQLQANKIQSDIMSVWGKGGSFTDQTTGKVYNVKFDVSVQLYNGKEKENPAFISEAWDPKSTDNFVEICARADEMTTYNEKTKSSRSQVDGGDRGQWRGYGSSSYAHEYGHLLGLDDLYDPVTNEPLKPEYEFDIMNTNYGRLEQYNIDDIIAPLIGDYNSYMNDRQEAIDANANLNAWGVTNYSNYVPPETYETEIDP